MTAQLKVGGTDVGASTYRAKVTQIDGLDPWPAHETMLLDIPGFEGSIVGNTRRRVSPRRISFRLYVDGRNGNTLFTKLDALADLLEGGVKTLEFPQRRANVIYTGYLEGARNVIVPSPAFSNQQAYVDCTFLCPQPYGVDASATVVSGSSGSALSCPMGTAPSDCIIVITANGGAVTTPIILHKNSAAAELHRIELETLSTAAYKYRVDTTYGGHVEFDGGSGYVNGMNLITNANYRFPDLRPEYGVRGGTSQTITVTDGGGVADVEITYYKRWR
jgi:phage-related protein